MTARREKTSTTVNWVWIVVLVIFTIVSIGLFGDAEYMEKTGPFGVWLSILIFLGFTAYNAFRIIRKKQLRCGPAAEAASVASPRGGTSTPTAHPDGPTAPGAAEDPERFSPPLEAGSRPGVKSQSHLGPSRAAPPGPQFADNGEVLYRGSPLSDSVDVVGRLKRQGKLEEALDVAQGAMFAMAEVGATNPDNVMEYYVIEVAIILHKLKRYREEAQTLREWLDLGLPSPREDYRVDIRKRLAKANEQWTRAEGRDAAIFTAEWRRLIDEHKDAQKRYIASGVSVPSSGRTAAGGSHYPVTRAPKLNKFMPTLDDLLEPDFVAVDFETANRRSGASACQVALVRFLDGEVVDRYVTYLKPPAPLDYYEFSRIHGITEQQTQSAPRWDEVAPQIEAFVGTRPVYAHNAAFDAKVWEELDTYYGIHTITSRFYCTYVIAREALPTLPDLKLPTVVGAIDTDFKLDHHKADSDAEGCGLIVAALQYHAAQEALM